jgi:hypothetical protein
VGLADDVSIEPGIGHVAREGEFALLPEETTTYTLVAANSAGRAEARATVRVLGADEGSGLAQENEKKPFVLVPQNEPAKTN